MMEETTQRESPEADALRAELTDIANNPGNPLHAGYVRGDASVSRILDQRYAKVYGSGQVSIESNEIATIVTPLTGPREPEPTPAKPAAGTAGTERDDALPPEEAKLWSSAVESLRSEWGGEFDARMEAVLAGHEAMQQKLGPELGDALGDALLEAGGTRELVYKVLANLGRG